MLVGGGTGGHIMPLLAVAHELKLSDHTIKVVAVIDKTTKFGHLLDSSPNIDRVERVSAGKLRRYPNQSFLRSLFDIKTIALNLRDFGRTVVGIFESLQIMSRIKPDAIFIKGGFVAVPVGVAAFIKKRQFVTHDSDAQPGLANRLIARWSKQYLVGMPAENYDYPPGKILQVGIPVSDEFDLVTNRQRRAFRQEINIPEKSKMVLITGGSQGAQSLNAIISESIDSLLKDSSMYIVHQTGVNSNDLPSDTAHYKKQEYITNLHVYTGAADLVITRAGSSLAELARQARACIVIPAPHLAGGHQIKNANLLTKHKAAIVLDQEELAEHPQQLTETVEAVLRDVDQARQLGENLKKFYPGDAAKKIADTLIGLND